MRRPGDYGDSGGNAYVAAQMQQMSGQRMENKSGHYQGRPESFNSDKGHSYGNSKADGQWRWERDGSKVPNKMSPHMFNEAQGVDASRSYYQSQRPDPRASLEKQVNNDLRSQHHEEDMDIGYEDNRSSQTFEGLEQKFLDDIMKLSKEQTDAEDAENARHREKINVINVQYQEQLAVLRAQHTSQRDEFLRRESLTRQQLYQQAAAATAMDHYAHSDSHGYGAVATGEARRSYSTDNYDSYRERDRYVEQRGQYPGGRVYDTGSRYY